MLFCGQTVLAASSHRQSVAAYARAENVHRHLEAKPLSRRTREDYERAQEGYRAVYHGDPASPDAGRSIAAVADLLSSEARCFHDERLFHDAVAQWEFLRREYPGSPLRQRALFEEGQIEQNDLHDHNAARKIYRGFLTHYPYDPLAQQARAQLDGAHDDLRGETTSPRAAEPSAFPQKKYSNIEHASTTPPEFFRAVAAPENLARSQITRIGLKQAAPARRAVRSPIFPRSDFSTNLDVSRSHSANSASATEMRAAAVPAATIQAVRYWAAGDSTRLAVDMNEAVPYHAYLAQNGKQITLIFFGARPSESLISHSILVEHDANLRSIRASNLTSDQAELVLELSHPASFSSFALSNPDRLILDVRGARQGNLSPHSARLLARTNAPMTQSAQEVTPAEIPATYYREGLTRTQSRIQQRPLSLPARFPADVLTHVGTAPEVLPETAPPAEPSLLAGPTINGQHSMTRVLGLRIRRIVIDAGHGGHDSGTLGPGGLEEKDVALDVALRLGHLLHQRLGANVIYTRRTDKFVPLEERTAIANRAHADLFLSIHANSSSEPEVRGVETYFLNFTASPDALQVAARENAISNRSVHDLSDLVRKITLSDKIDESREFAADVQQSLYDGLSSGNAGLRNRGVKQAPFMVLIGADMPSILAEISFLTNPEDESELAQPHYRERLAEALYLGVAQYVDGMSGVRVAKTAPPEAPSGPAE